jgi:hypothetical protein
LLGFVAQAAGGGKRAAVVFPKKFAFRPGGWMAVHFTAPEDVLYQTGNEVRI